MVSAVATHEPDPARPPGRRAWLSLLAGVLAAAIGLAGFAVWGLLQPGGSTKWKSGAAVIVEKESGAKFVYLDGVLHPVANYASALLIVGAAKTISVARRSLAGAPRGPLLGISGAPDALPQRRDLLGGPWAVCGEVGPGRSTVLVGSVPAGGRLGPDGALVSTPDGAVHLVWQGRRARVRDPQVVLGMLVWGTPAAVPAAVVNAFAVVADIARVPIARRGQAFASVPGARVGQVFLVDGRQHAVALADGLASVTPFQAALVLGDPATVEQVGQTAPAPLSPGQYASLPRTTFPGTWDGLPAEVPRPVTPGPGSALCASGGDAVAGPAPPRGSALAGVSKGLADEVRVPPGRGVLAVAGTGVIYLVTDLGVRHQLASADVLTALGYAGAKPVPVPAEILALLPTGPGLYPQAARAVVGS